LLQIRKGITVALDITITETLRREGIARELVNRIQNIRKDSGFEVTDKIKVQLHPDAELEASVNENLSYIMSETLTEKLDFTGDINGDGTAIEFDDIKTKILITK
jgi:isoleucyl-tRNA synthetase